MSLDERHARWQPVRRVLAVRLDNLGDLLMTTPALAAIKEGRPDVELTLLGSPGAMSAAPHLPMVDEVWPFTAPWMQIGAEAGTPAERESLGQREAAMIDRLAEAGFDAAVIFTVCTQSALPAALMCRLAGIPLRLAHSRENPYALLSDWCPDPDSVAPRAGHEAQQRMARHEVARQLALVASVGWRTGDDRLRFVVRDVDRDRLRWRLHAAGLPHERPYAVLHPGATAASRRWPAERFGLAARRLQDEGCAVVFSGGAADVARCEDALQALRAARPAGAPAHPAALSLAGQLELGELAALIEGAEVLVANNSAPSHLAAAVGTPVVTLYALTNPQHTPWRVAARVLYHDVPCRWCLKSVCPERHHACLQQIEPAQVADAAIELARERAAPAARSLAA